MKAPLTEPCLGAAPSESEKGELSPSRLSNMSVDARDDPYGFFSDDEDLMDERVWLFLLALTILPKLFLLHMTLTWILLSPLLAERCRFLLWGVLVSFRRWGSRSMLRHDGS